MILPIDHAVNIYLCFLGQETTALMLTFALIELSQHLEVKQRSDTYYPDSAQFCMTPT